jgi:hypothetical protein
MIISLHPDIAERAEMARQEMNKHNKEFKYFERDFLHHLFMMGLLKTEYEILPKLTGKPCEIYKRYQ